MERLCRYPQIQANLKKLKYFSKSFCCSEYQFLIQIFSEIVFLIHQIIHLILFHVYFVF